MWFFIWECSLLGFEFGAAGAYLRGVIFGVFGDALQKLLQGQGAAFAMNALPLECRGGKSLSNS